MPRGAPRFHGFFFCGSIGCFAEDLASSVFRPPGFSLDTLSVIGALQFFTLGEQAEVATHLELNSARRSLFAFLTPAFLGVATINMFAATQLLPPLADVRGGTRVTGSSRRYSGLTDYVPAHNMTHYAPEAIERTLIFPSL